MKKIEIDEKIRNELNGKKGLLFDFDGTIANTEKLQLEAYNILMKKYGISIGNEKWLSYIGNSENIIYEMMKEEFGINFDNEELMKERLGIYLDLVNKTKLKPFPFFMQILDKYSDKKYFILTSNREDVVKNMLTNWNILNKFEKIISIASKEYSKREILENTEKHLKLNKSEIVYFEDMDRNLNIAKELNIVTIGVEHEFNKNKLKNCDYIIEYNIN